MENKNIMLFAVGSLAFVVMLVSLSLSVDTVKETIYPQTAPSRSCVDFSCASWFEQGSSMLFNIESTTWKTKCDLSTSFLHGTKDIAVPTLKIYKISPSPKQTVAILEGDRLSFFDKNQDLSSIVRWNIPYSAPSGQYFVEEAVYCYRNARFDGTELRGKITGYDGVDQISTITKGYFRVSKEEPCLDRSDRCVGEKWRECTIGDSYNGYAWKDARSVVGKCGVECISSINCPSGQECNSNYKCVDICKPRFDRFCKGNSIYEKNSCDGNEKLIKSCSSGDECLSGECFKIELPPVEPECPSLGTKPCNSAIITRFGGCDVWDDSNCQITSSCTDGEENFKTCPDSSRILESECINGEMEYTEIACPQIECRLNSDCAKGYQCDDDGKCIEDIEPKVVKPAQGLSFWWIVFIISGGIVLLTIFVAVLTMKREKFKK